MSLEGNAQATNDLNVLRGKISSLSAYALDKTLTIEGASAEAKSVGDALAQKVDIADITNNLATNDSEKPLSAAQGVALKNAIDALKDDTDITISTAQNAAENAQTAADAAQAAANAAQNAADAITLESLGGATADHTHTAADVDAIPTSQKGAASGVASLDASGKVEAEQSASSIVTTDENKTLSLGDAGKLILCNSESDIVITIPSNADVAFPIGTEIEILRYYDGGVTVQASNDVYLYCIDAVASTAGTSKAIANRYGVVALKAVDTDIWIMAGDIE